MEALLDRMGERPPVMDFVACELERLGYSLSYRVIESAGAEIVAARRSKREFGYNPLAPVPGQPTMPAAPTTTCLSIQGVGS